MFEFDSLQAIRLLCSTSAEMETNSDALSWLTELRKLVPTELKELKLTGLTVLNLTRLTKLREMMPEPEEISRTRFTSFLPPVEVDQCRVGLEGPTHPRTVLGLHGVGGCGKTTLARVLDNFARKVDQCIVGVEDPTCVCRESWLMGLHVSGKFILTGPFSEFHRDPSTSDVQVRPSNRGCHNCRGAAGTPHYHQRRGPADMSNEHNIFTQAVAAHSGESTITYVDPDGGRKLNRELKTKRGSKRPIVDNRPPKWTNKIWIPADNNNDAEYIADAVYICIGGRPFHCMDVTFQYPPLRLATCELLTREPCAVCVESIAKGPAHQKQRGDYLYQVKEVVLQTVKSPEAVLFLSSLRPPASSDEAAVKGEIAYDANEGGRAEEVNREDSEECFCSNEIIARTNDESVDFHSILPQVVMDESLEERTAESSPCLEKNSTIKKRTTSAVTDDDDLRTDYDDTLTKLARLVKQQIEDAFSLTLLPLVSVLRSREENEQKHREQMLALEQQKLALKREKLLFEQRRGAKHPRSSH